MEHKRVHVTNCPTILLFVKAIKDVTNKSLRECKEIVDSLRDKENPRKLNGTLLLNESSITPSQWKEIVSSKPLTLEWKYVEERTDCDY